jgi:hypothetical protein
MKISNVISEIAEIIQNDWKNVSPEAAPYLKMMHRLRSIYDIYGETSAKSVIRNFLNHAKYWQGDVAKEVKAKLKELIG